MIRSIGWSLSEAREQIVKNDIERDLRAVLAVVRKHRRDDLAAELRAQLERVLCDIGEISTRKES